MLITNYDEQLLQITIAFLLQIIMNCDRYYKLLQNILQITTAITNYGNYYKLRQNIHFNSVSLQGELKGRAEKFQ